MIDCASCGSVLILSGGSSTSSLVSVTDKMDFFGNRVREYNCECGHPTSLAAGGIINKPEPEQVEPEPIQGQLAGVREFTVTDDGNLGGLVHGGAWEPDKPHRATCAKGEAIGLGRPSTYSIRIGSWDDHYAPRRPHDAPDYDCQCGFYSFNSLEEADKAGDGFQFPNRIRAVVSAWGDVIICEHGFRAEWMQIEAIVKQPTFAWGVEIDATAAWARIADRYSVPVIEVPEVAEFCEALGTVVDGPGERARAEVEVRNQFNRRRQELVGSLDEFGKSAGKTLEDNRFQAFLGAVDKSKSKPAFWLDLPSNTKKGRDLGV